MRIQLFTEIPQPLQKLPFHFHFRGGRSGLRKNLLRHRIQIRYLFGIEVRKVLLLLL